MNRLHRSLAIPVFAASLVLLGACGANASTVKSATTKDGKATTTVGKGTAGSNTTTAGKSTTTATPDTTASPDTKPSKGGKVQLSGSFCDMVKQLNEDDNNLFDPEESTDPATSLKNLKEAFSNIVDIMHQLQAKAPAEVKADVDFTVEQFDKVNAQVQKLTSYSPEALSTIMGADFDSPEAQKHSDRLDAYTKDKCGFDPNADRPTADTVTVD